MLFHCDCTKFAITVSALMPNRIVNFDNRLMKKILLLCGLLLCSAFYVVADDTVKQPTTIDAIWFKANYAKAEYMIPMRDGVRLISHQAKYQPEMVKDLAFALRQRVEERLVMVIGNVSDGKPTLNIMLSDDVVAAGVDAGAVVREAAKLINGGGGGQKHYATAGGKCVDGLQQAVDKAVTLIMEKLN